MAKARNEFAIDIDDVDLRIARDGDGIGLTAIQKCCDEESFEMIEVHHARRLINFLNRTIREIESGEDE